MSFFCRLPPDLGLRTWLATEPRESFQKNLIGVRGRNSCMTPASMCGMILICSEQGLIIYIGDASQMRKHEALFGIATVHPMAVTTVGTEQHQKCYNQVFFWPSIFKDAYEFMRCCDKCQRTGGISRSNEMPLPNIMEVEIFYCRGIDFMGPLPSSYGNVYILVAVDYVSK